MGGRIDSNPNLARPLCISKGGIFRQKRRGHREPLRTPTGGKARDSSRHADLTLLTNGSGSIPSVAGGVSLGFTREPQRHALAA